MRFIRAERRVSDLEFKLITREREREIERGKARSVEATSGSTNYQRGESRKTRLSVQA